MQFPPDVKCHFVAKLNISIPFFCMPEVTEEVTETVTTTDQAEEQETVATVQQEVVPQETPSMTEQVKEAVIRQVVTTTVGGAVQVSLSPVELTKQERERLKRPRRPVQVGENTQYPVNLVKEGSQLRHKIHHCKLYCMKILKPFSISLHKRNPKPPDFSS